MFRLGIKGPLLPLNSYESRMTKKEPVTPAFGAFLSKCQKEQLVNGKHLTNKAIAQETMMSTKTYNLLKKG